MLRLCVQYTMDSRKWFLSWYIIPKSKVYYTHKLVLILDSQSPKKTTCIQRNHESTTKTAMLGPALQQLQIEHLNVLPPTASGYQPQVLVGKILRFRRFFFREKRLVQQFKDACIWWWIFQMSPPEKDATRNFTHWHQKCGTKWSWFCLSSMCKKNWGRAQSVGKVCETPLLLENLPFLGELTW